MLERVAYHEAGHGVACFVQRMPVASISVKSGYRGGLEGGYRTCSVGGIQALLRVCLAGDVAERIAFSGEPSQGSGQDFAEARAILGHLFRDRHVLERELQHLHRQTVGMLSLAPHWRAVEVLAGALMTARRLTGEEALALIAKAEEHA